MEKEINPSLANCFQQFEKSRKSLSLVSKLLARITIPVDFSKDISEEELVDYDALSSRFERTTEMMIKLFRSIENYEEAEKASSLRDCLNLMAKLDLIESPDEWMEIRILRNKISHDYLPEQLNILWQAISDFTPIIEKSIVQTNTFLATKQSKHLER